MTKYDRSGLARCLAAFDALAPEHQRDGQRDKDDAAEDPSDDRGGVAAVTSFALYEVHLGGRQAGNVGLCCLCGRKWGERS